MVRLSQFIRSIAYSLWLVASIAAAQFTATVDRNTLSQHETLTLTLEADKRMQAPNVAALDPDFEVLSQSKRSHTSWVNGKVTSVLQWQYQLAPKRAGKLTIPAFSSPQGQTKPIHVTVTKQTAANTGTDSFNGYGNLHVELGSDKTEMFVQEQLLVTLTLTADSHLSQLQVDPLQLNDTVIQEIERNEHTHEQDGKTQHVITIQYSVLPGRSGPLTLGPITFTAKAFIAVPGSMFAQARSLRAKSNALTIHVKPQPAQITATDWLPATWLNISETWSDDPSTVRVGDSLTRTITVQAVGLSAEQLPPVTVDGNAYVNVYPQPPVLTNKTDKINLIGFREQAFTLVFTQPGQLTLPALSQPWWDIQKNQEAVAQLAAQVITIIGDPSAAPQSPPNFAPKTTASLAEQLSNGLTQASENKAPSLKVGWLLAVVLIVAFFVVACTWYRTDKPFRFSSKRDKSPLRPTLSRCLKAIKRACKDTNVNSAYEQLMMLPQALSLPPQNLDALVTYYDHPPFTAAVHSLLQTKFSQQPSQNEAPDAWGQLYETLQQAQRNRRKVKKASLALKPLYPDR